MTTSIVTALLARHVFRFRDEGELQDGIANVLTRAGVTFTREVRLAPRDRIDFLLEDGLGVEVKVACSWAELVRQLNRYAQREEIRELLLVTARLSLRDVPAEMEGKPINVYALPVEF